MCYYYFFYNKTTLDPQCYYDMFGNIHFSHTYFWNMEATRESYIE